MITGILDTVESLRRTTGRPYEAICRSVRLHYSSFKRWKARRNRQYPLIRLPGPKKVRQFDSGRLDKAIRSLRHCRKRSHGALGLYGSYRDTISRRDFGNLVAMARYDAYVEHRKNLRRIHWRVPGLVWSMDGTEWGHDEFGRKLHLHNLMDLASNYKFSPIAGELACGEGISAHLDRHYMRFGSPLFQKRDNGGNLNHSLVNETLDEFGVIPLNSPVYYPQYNGSMEAAQKTFKTVIRNKLSPFDVCPREHFGAYAEAAINELNHQPRRGLKNKNACQVFFENRNRHHFNRRERRSINDWILDKANDIFVRMRDKSANALQSAYRIAVETWLRLKGFIFVSIGGKVLPNF